MSGLVRHRTGVFQSGWKQTVPVSLDRQLTDSNNSHYQE